MLISLAMSLAGAATAALPVVAADLDCAKMLEVRRPAGAPRPIEATDLIETLDIGSNGGMESDPVFTLSPDQSRLAVAVRRADGRSNSYCSGIYIVSQDGQASLIDAGPGVAFWRYDNFFGTRGFPTGVTKVITPLWSSNGDNLAFLKLVNDRLQLWRWDVGGHSRPVAAPEDDIVDFRFGADGKSLVYKQRADGPPTEELNEEALRGYRLDERFFPFASRAPFPRGGASYRFYRVDLDGSARGAATEAEIAAFANDRSAALRNGAIMVDVKADAEGMSRIHMLIGTAEQFCRSANCTDIEGQPWVTQSGHIRFVRREGWGRSLAAIYEWKGGDTDPDRLFQTSDLLMGCVPIDDDVLCVRENSARPRYIDRISLQDGKSRPIFEPNPDHAKIVHGRVERLQWINAMGIPSFGDLVYPPTFQPGRRYPLIITQYESRGFLRGGTGDEFPIQLFAKAGYLVLNIERPQSPVPAKQLAPLERQRRENADFLARRNILSTIEAKVLELIDTGLVDPDRIGITGLSDGSTTTQFAALHSQMFKAASISGCCWEPSQTWLLGTAIQQHYQSIGWPASPEASSAIWSQMSLSRNASSVAFPILMQVADGELYPTLEAVRALRAANSPVDVYIFPDELHIKRQPTHRLNVYRRNLRWFDFWLMDKMPADGIEREEASRWAQMRRDWKQGPIDLPTSD